MMPEREESPDWLRCFQPPTRPVTTLSSDSEPSEEDETTTCTVEPSSKKRLKFDHAKPPSKRTKTHLHNQPVWPLSSDSDSHTHTAITDQPIHDQASKVAQKDDQASTSKVVNKRKSADHNQAKQPFQMEDTQVLGEVGDVDAAEEGLPEKHIESRVSSSTLALLLPEKVSRCKVLVECEGESIDLSGDMGAVGRVIIPDTSSGEPEMFLDLKGTIYRTTIVPSRTFCVVSVGQSEAKIEAIMNDFVLLKAQSNVYDAETMVEGTLEGFSFDSDDETDKVPKDVKADQNEGAEEQTGKKPKGKQEKKAGGTQKKGKAGGGKQLPKKRKPQATKKSKAKK